MEREQQQSKQQEINTKEIAYTDSPRNVAAAANDRLKRDEWSEGAVSSLLEAYEAKWTMRNRAKLKGQDWEEVARHVSARASASKSAKTQTQCKNKIESMKKRYRSESAAAADSSSWPLYPRLDLLLRGNGVGVVTAATTTVAVAVVSSPTTAAVAADLPSEQPIPPPLQPAVTEVGKGLRNSHGSNGGDRTGKEGGDGGINNGEKVRKEESEKNPIDETESSTAAMDLEKLKKRNKDLIRKEKEKAKRGREEYWEVGDSIRWVAEVVIRSEQARMETLREIERMRTEAEAKRGEMELKRTEIIANTQLQIAKLFARGSSVQEWKNPT